jgi:microcystin-dependent protein
MSQPYIGEIRMFAGNFEPAGWVFCDGRLLPISEYDTLFVLIGTTYGGDGQSTFALPDLRGRMPVHQGNGFILAQTGGVESVALGVNQIPAHNHAVRCEGTNAGTQPTPAGNFFASAGVQLYTAAANAVPVAMRAGLVGAAGGSVPHNNFQPYLCVDFIISLFGIFPHQ